MPFQSEAQRRFLYANHPAIAAEFQAHTPKGKKLPHHKRKKRRAKAAHPWLVKMAGRFDESKHRRDHGKFSTTGGAGGNAPRPSQPARPAAPGSRHNPDLDAAMGMGPPPSAPPAEGRHPSRHNPEITYGHADDRDSDDAHFDRQIAEAHGHVTAARRQLERAAAKGPKVTPEIRQLQRRLAAADKKVGAARAKLEKLRAGAPPAPRVGGDPFAEHVTGTQNVREFPKRQNGPAGRTPMFPHEKSQELAHQAAERLRMTANMGGPEMTRRAHADAVQALDAHMRAGLQELKRRAQAFGPRGGNAYRQAAQAFKAKLSNARARIDQLAGKGPPTVPGKRPPPLPAYRHEPPPVPRQPGRPPPVADRGRVRPFVDMKELDLPGLVFKGHHPWLRKTWEEGKHPRDTHGQFTAWHDQAGVTANSKPQAKHNEEAERFRSELTKLPHGRLKAIAGEVGFHIRPGLSKEQVVSGLIQMVGTRRGMAQRTEQ